MKNVDFGHATLLLLHFGLKGFTNTLDSIFLDDRDFISHFQFSIQSVRCAERKNTYWMMRAVR